MPRFVKAVPITDENREIIRYLTNGRGISKEDALRLATDLVGKRDSSRVRGGIADYLFGVSREDIRMGDESRRNGNSESGTYTSTSNGSNKDNIQRLTYSKGTLYGFEHNGTIGIFTEDLNPETPLRFNIITKLIL